MAVYVDRLRTYRVSPTAGNRWCHMFADTEDELHEMAHRVGMRREWFQDHDDPKRRHYDLLSSRRRLAVLAGAVEVSAKEYLKGKKQNVNA